jgi:hypothetical protein
MLELKRNLYWEIDLLTIENLTKEHFNKSPDFIEDTGFDYNKTHYPTQLSLEKDDQILDSFLIEELLESNDTVYKCDRIDHAIWLLIMKDILPEGDYLVSL